MYPGIYQGYHFQKGVWMQSLYSFYFLIFRELFPVANMYGCHGWGLFIMEKCIIM